ncbi:hypothetical protein [Paenibacillus sp. 1P07SE]|uniref:hypothetical protein n=1 Tax=Paenibacillus sp. 1P07SE TaxID=3132209 RepID=UPI0039A6797F
MTGVLNTIARLWQLQTVTLANRLIYYAQRLPLLGRRVSERAYAAVRAKRLAGSVAVGLRILGGLLESFLYIGLMLALPLQIWADGWTAGEQQALFVHMYFCISVLMAAVSSAKVLEPSKMKYTAVRLMRMVPTRYMRAVLIYRYGTFFLYQSLAMAVIGSGWGITLAQGLLLVGAVTMWRVASEWLHLALFRRSGIILVKKTGIVILVMVLTFAAAYLPLTPLSAVPLFGAMLLGQSLVLALLILAGLVAGYGLLKKVDYTDPVQAATKRDDPLLNMEQLIADAQQKSVQANDLDYNAPLTLPLSDREGGGSGKQGYAYIHQIFVARHGSLIRTPFRKRLGVLGGLGVVLACLALLFADTLDVASIEAYVPFVILAMFYLTMGDQLCKVLFYHCDMPLLRYPFYRKGAVQHFRLRLGRLLGMNVLIGAGLAAVLSVFILIVSGGQVPGVLLPLWILTLALAVFFSVHHLLLYYLLQPYTTELNTKNPFFILLNSLVSLGFVGVMVLGPALWALTVVVALLSIVYLCSALPLVSRYAPSCFRVK